MRDKEDTGWPKIGEFRHLATKSEVRSGKKKCNDHYKLLNTSTFNWNDTRVICDYQSEVNALCVANNVWERRKKPHCNNQQNVSLLLI